MPLVLREPELRFEFEHERTLTVLEGEELGKLNSRFFWHLRRQLKRHDEFMAAFVAAVVLAYQGMYGKGVVTGRELETMSTADARKLDLFYRGMFLVMCHAKYPDEDWDKLLYGRRAFGIALNEVVTLKPNLFGIGLDLNAVITRLMPGPRDRRSSSLQSHE